MTKSRYPNDPKSIALKISSIYFIVSIIWIFASDHVLSAYNANYQLLTLIASLKGTLFVIFTSILIYILVNRYLTSIKQSEMALKKSEEKFKALIYNSTDIIRILDKDGLIVFDSPSSSRILGYPEGYFIGKSPLEFIHPDDLEKVKNDLNDVYVGKNPGIPTEFRIRKADGTYLPVESIAQNLIDIPGIGGIVVNTHPIKDRKKLEEHLIKTNRSLRLLSDCNQSLIRAKDEEELLKEICDIIIDKGDYIFTWVGYPDDNEKILRPVAFAGKEENYLQNICVSLDNDEFGKGPSGNAYRKRKEFIINDLSLDESFAPWRNEALKRGYASVISLPLFNKGNVMGIISIYSSEIDRFDDMEIELLKELADDLAYGIVSIRSDIERKQVRMALEESEHKYHTLFDNAGDGILIMKGDKFVDCNSKAMEIFGASKDEIIGETPYGIFSPEYQSDQGLSKQKALKYINKALNGYQQLFEWKHKRLDGTTIFTEVNLNRLKIGNDYYLMAIVRDVTERMKTEKTIKEQLSFLKDLMNTIPYPIFYKNKNYVYQGCNKAFEEFIGLSKEEIIGKTVYDVSPKELADKYHEKDQELLENLKLQVYEAPVQYADGSKHEVLFNKTTYNDIDGNVAGIIGVMVDITDLKKAHEALQESETYYKTIFENTGTATIIIEEDTTISLVNSEFEKLCGAYKDEIEGKVSWTDFVADKSDLDRMKGYHELRGIDDASVPRNYEFKFINKKREIKDAFITVALIPGTKKRLVSLLDITERKKSDKALKNSLKEKELLLREVHHRVKNNLQIMSSLLNLQSNNIKNESIFEVFMDSQSRIKSMALIHEKLYQSKNLMSINFREYIRSLVINIISTYAPYSGIMPKINVDNIFFDIDTAIPCGLIINELVMNSIKHAFPITNSESENPFDDPSVEIYDSSSSSSPEEKYISIELFNEDNHFKLIISDNGIGIPEELDITKSETLGLQLVTNLVNQLDGEIKLDRNNGSKFIIVFNELKYKERV